MLCVLHGMASSCDPPGVRCMKCQRWLEQSTGAHRELAVRRLCIQTPAWGTECLGDTD